ncbi:endonuclease [Rubrivirga marina]|uniref:Cadherin domain-containing protein n=1 Tax=Rubrivirga marina TaxID=1196024 RepID=A0A271J016_9BACT|nr:endonuclease [Rubrivirga marina]PAP76305.1 hypothetical protein BSZ37_07520 [Rubrivirga marina]
MRHVLVVAAVAALSLPALAQGVCPGLEGSAGLACVVDGYRPSSVLSLNDSKDRLYDTVDRGGQGGQDGVFGLYTGHFVPFDGAPNADPSQDVYNNDGSNGINQEHVFPRSRGTDGNAAERDLHHLFPTRGAVNSARGNDPFGTIDDGAASSWYRGGERTTARPSDPDAWSQSSGGRFEPRAAVRGDVARAMFYVAAIYSGTVDGAWFDTQLDDLLAWHQADPASDGEQFRSRRVAQFQSGCGVGECLNPFAFDPTLAQRIFAPGTGGPGEPPGNGAPALVADVVETDEDVPLVVAVLANDGDPDGDALTVTVVTRPQGGTTTTDGTTVTYTPALDFSGTDQFEYSVSDGEATSTASVRVTVRSVNDAPTAPEITAPADGAVLVVEGDPDTPVAVAWTASTDAEGDQFAYRWELAETAVFDAVVLSVSAQGPSVRLTVGALADALPDLGAGESVELWHRAVADDGEDAAAGPASRVVVERGVVTAGEGGPGTALAVAVRPNPARSVAIVSVNLGVAADVRVEVVDALGRTVAVPLDGWRAAGAVPVTVDAAALPAGLYLVRVVTEAEVAVARLTVVR